MGVTVLCCTTAQDARNGDSVLQRHQAVLDVLCINLQSAEFVQVVEVWGQESAKNVWRLTKRVRVSRDFSVVEGVLSRDAASPRKLELELELVLVLVLDPSPTVGPTFKVFRRHPLHHSCSHECTPRKTAADWGRRRPDIVWCWTTDYTIISPFHVAIANSCLDYRSRDSGIVAASSRPGGEGGHYHHRDTLSSVNVWYRCDVHENEGVCVCCCWCLGFTRCRWSPMLRLGFLRNVDFAINKPSSREQTYFVVILFRKMLNKQSDKPRGIHRIAVGVVSSFPRMFAGLETLF